MAVGRNLAYIGMALSLAVAACGDDDDGQARPSRRSTTTTSTTVVEETTTSLEATTTTTSATTSTPAGSTPGSTGGPTAAGAPTTAPRPAPSSTAAPTTLPRSLRIKLTEVAKLTQPLDLVARPGTGRLYIAEKTGRVKVLRDGRGEVVLDVSAEVSNGNEQGLLGIAFSPDGRHLYFDFTDRAGDTRLEEVTMGGGDGIDAASRRLILTVDQPAANHNGGHLAFGPDGKLWFGLGDGGGSGDQYGNAQNLGTLLGDIIRIDPRPGNAGTYGIPADNPFVGRQGARGEIAVSGVRNPWRFSFDRGTGDLWIGDVGQNAWEEVDHLPAGRILGANLGWPFREGNHAFKGTPPAGLTDPVHEYGRSDGQSIAGGVVYRGQALPELHGVYLFSDTYGGRLWGLLAKGRRDFLAVPGGLVAGFGEDAAGEVYVISLAGAIFRIDRG